MGMLIHRHRDRHKLEPGAVPESGEPTPTRKADLQEQAAFLGLSTRGTIAQLTARIEAAKAKSVEPSEDKAPEGQPAAPSEGGEGGDHPEEAADTTVVAADADGESADQ